MTKREKESATRCAAQVPEHHCHARGCSSTCPPEHLMCRRHWAMVPANLQRAVWNTYRPGQCDDKQPSQAWHAAADAAIASVAAAESSQGQQLALGLTVSPSFVTKVAYP